MRANVRLWLNLGRFNRLPTGFVEQGHGKANRHGKGGCRVLGKHTEAYADHTASRAEQGCSRTAFGGARVIYNSARIQIRYVALSHLRLDTTGFGEMREQCF